MKSGICLRHLVLGTATLLFLAGAVSGGCLPPLVPFSGVFSGDFIQVPNTNYCPETICGDFTVTGGGTFQARVFAYENAAQLGCSVNNNHFTVTGNGTTFTSYTEDLAYSGNTMTIASGAYAQLFAISLLSEASTLSPANTLSVIGPGAILSLYNLQVGWYGINNSVKVGAGGLLQCNTSLTIGEDETACSNLVEVSGSGATLTMSEPFSLFELGLYGTYNRLVVTNGGTFASYNSWIGSTTSAIGNEATVAGASSSWSCYSNLPVGWLGARCGLRILDGGMLDTPSAQVGFWSEASNCYAHVSGNNSRWYSGEQLMVGVYSPSNLLDIAGGGYVFSGEGVIGAYDGAIGNKARVSASGSIWQVTSNLLVGLETSGNSLVIQNGGTVASATGFVGYSSAATGNSVSLGGANAAWSNSGRLVIGRLGSRSSLVISNGARAVNTDGIVGDAFSSTGNTVIVSGTGAQWLNAGELMLGPGGGGNRLAIEAGGLVTNMYGTIGGASDGNRVLVSGAGSTWQSTGLDVGYYSSENSLVISNGGRVLSGLSTIDAANDALITGVGSSWTSANLWVSGLLKVNSGGRMASSGGAVSGGNAWISDAGSTWSNTLALTVNGTMMVSAGGQVISRSGGIGFGPGLNQVQLTDPDTRWDMTTNLSVGFAAPASLQVSGGASVNNAEGRIGNGSATNLVAISDSGEWNSTRDMALGYSNSPANRMLISDGGFVSCNNAGIGRDVNSSGNVAVVTDAGSLLEVAGYLRVGVDGGGNSLTVSNAAAVSNLVGIIGDTSSSNMAVVTGSGSRWWNEVKLSIGAFGSGNRLAVLNGGRVESGDGSLGGSETSSNNVAWIAGNSASWSVSNQLSVGSSGRGNTLMVTDGGTLLTKAAYVGQASNENVLAVQGPASIWSNKDTCVIGRYGSSNSLLVSGGGMAVTTNNAVIGAESGGIGNQAIVLGSGSVWRVGQQLTVGDWGYRSQLVVSNGGRVVCTSAVIGVHGSACSARVTGSDSLWFVSSSTPLIVGQEGWGNEIAVERGGAVVSSGATLGLFAGATLNRAIMTDPFSVWRNDGDFTVGLSGDHCTLIISNQAWLSAASTRVGVMAESLSNEVVVVGGIWSNGGNIVVGVAGGRNRVTVADDGLVFFASNFVVGSESSAISNTVILADIGTVCQGVGPVVIGDQGAGNRMIIHQGALLVDTDGLIGFGSDGNAVLVNDHAAWGNLYNLVVGYSGSFNYLAIHTNGGVTASRAIIGHSAPASDNAIFIAKGFLRMTNAAGTGLIDVRRGLLDFQDGTIIADQLHVTNASGQINFLGGSLQTRQTRISNGGVFEVGNGITNATLTLIGGDHFFADGMEIAENAVLVGSTGPQTSDAKALLSRQANGVSGISGGSITNRGVIRVAPGATLDIAAPVVNHGVIDAVDGAVNFLGGLVNNGTLLDSNSVPRINYIARTGTNIVLGFTTTSNATYVLDTASSPAGTWTNLLTNLIGKGGSIMVTNAAPPATPARIFRGKLNRP